MFYAMFGLTYPMGVFAALQVAELWLNHLPAPVGTALEVDKIWGRGVVCTGRVRTDIINVWCRPQYNYYCSSDF